MGAKGLNLTNGMTGGGGGGTDNYNDLSNKPQVNGNTLTGNKTSDQLGLESPTPKATSMPAGGFLPKVYYELGELTGTVAFLIASPTNTSILNWWDWQFDTGATAPSVTWPTGLVWVGGSAPTVDANTRYEISIVNNMASFIKAALS